jgi:multicomponent K+:H+ antiporter subunit D
MIGVVDHLIIAPVVVPLVAGAIILLLREHRRSLKTAISVVSTFALVGIAIALLALSDSPGPISRAAVYRLGDWPAPFGIVLVADRLSALMLLLTSILSSAAVLFSLSRWQTAGPHFHSLLQFLLMGINGAFLTGDLFNLFVFFELLLAASYGLALYGSGRARVVTGLHYIAVNLAASLLFLIGVSLIYAVVGTLNMADIAARIPDLSAEERPLLEAGAGILGTAFLLKAGIWPLCFWLPSTYAAAIPPVASIFAILTKVGVYILLRLWLLFFGDAAGQSAHFGGEWLLFGGMATIAFGVIGTLASQDMARLAGFCVLVSSGTVLTAIAIGGVDITAGALFYMASSTLGIGALFLLVELIERGREPGADVLAITREAYAGGEETDEATETGTPISATIGFVGFAFIGIGLVIAGLPPLSGFIAKFMLLGAALNPTGVAPSGPIRPAVWAFLVLLILSGLATLIAMTRAGIRSFWVGPDRAAATMRIWEIAPIALLLFVCAAQTLQAGPIMRFMTVTAQSLYAPGNYVRGVLSQKPEAMP